MKTLLSLLANRRLWKRLFWVHFTILSVLLLWPSLSIPPVMPRPDLFAHCAAFGPFSLALCLWNPFSARKPWIVALIALALGAAYGAATELLQLIPALGRTAALDDWAADVLGLLCGLAAFTPLQVWCLSRCASPRQ